MQVWRFFDDLIVRHQLDVAVVVDRSRQLGARHHRYLASGFHVAYWDSFSVSLVETIEALLVEDENENENRRELMYSWQKFIRLVVDQTRSAYLQQQARIGQQTSWTNADGCSNY